MARLNRTRLQGDLSLVQKIFYTKTGGAVATAVAAAIFGWLAVESLFLGGKTLMNVSQHPLGVPITFAVDTAGEPHGLTLDRAHSQRGKKRLAWTITDPDGKVLLEDQDIVPRASRVTKFTPRVTGKHTLLARRQASDPAAGSVTLIVTQGDRTLLLPVLDFLW